MDREKLQQLEALLREKVCSVCTDRNVNGSCDRLAEGSCTVMQKLPAVAEAILKVSSSRIARFPQNSPAADDVPVALWTKQGFTDTVTIAIVP